MDWINFMFGVGMGWFSAGLMILFICIVEKNTKPSKELSCPKCNGVGWIWRNDLDWSEQYSCDNCDGTGVIEK